MSNLTDTNPDSLRSRHQRRLSDMLRQDQNLQEGDLLSLERHRPRSASPPERRHYDGPHTLDDRSRLPAATLLIDPSNAHDVTLHLDLDLDDDLEAALEDMSRLRRLGHFKQALRMAEAGIKPFLHNRYVLVQYGMLLVDAMRYRELARLSVDYPPVLSPETLIEQNWFLLLRDVEIDTEIGLLNHLDNLSIHVKVAKDEYLSSSKFQVMNLWMFRHATLDMLTSYAMSAYQTLRSEGRIWEACDLIEAMLARQTVDDVLEVLLKTIDVETGSKSALQTLFDHWQAQALHESGCLAIINMFTTLALAYTKQLDQWPATVASMNIARQQAETLITHYGTHNARTRPFLHFLVAESLTSSRQTPSSQDVARAVVFDGFPRGKLIYQRGIRVLDRLLLPIYEPEGNEASPTWSPKRDDGAISVLRTVLEASNDLEDTFLAASCLQNLILRGAEDTDKVLKQLDGLYLTAGDFVARRDFLLFTYMLAKGPEDRQKLRLQILESGKYLHTPLNLVRSRILDLLDDRDPSEKALRKSKLRDWEIRDTSYQVDKGNEENGDSRDRNLYYNSNEINHERSYFHEHSARQSKLSQSRRTENEEVAGSNDAIHGQAEGRGAFRQEESPRLRPGGSSDHPSIALAESRGVSIHRTESEPLMPSRLKSAEELEEEGVHSEDKANVVDNAAIKGLKHRSKGSTSNQELEGGSQTEVSSDDES